jgi:four helix bundle protein
MASGSFRDLIAWQRAMDLVVEIYRLSERFPSSERFGLTNQLRRAAVSVASNIAEGQGRGAGPDFARFLRVAKGSAQEVETQIEIGLQLGFVERALAEPIFGLAAEICKILTGLIASIEHPREPKL